MQHLRCMSLCKHRKKYLPLNSKHKEVVLMNYKSGLRKHRMPTRKSKNLIPTKIFPKQVSRNGITLIGLEEKTTLRILRNQSINDSKR